jgi:hypothetical protein
VHQTVSFSFTGQRRQLTLALGDAYLRPGVAVHLLSISATTHATWLDPEDASTTAAILLEGFVWFDQAMRPLGPLARQVFVCRGYPVGEQLELLLTDDQLIALTALVGPAQVGLRIDFKATWLNGPAETHATHDQQTGYQIQPAQWTQMLEQAGTAVAVTIRVPSPLSDAAGESPSPTPASLHQAAKRLRQAQLDLRDGRYEDCARSCRLALENLEGLQQAPSAKEVFSVAAKDRTSKQHWAAVHYDLMSLLSAAHHDDKVTQLFQWTRQDAEAVLAATAGLLARFR